MSKVLVTGGAGFIGGYVVDELLQKGYQVIVVDNLSKEDSRIPKDVEFFNVDLTDAENTAKLFRNVDVCINMASKIGGIGYFHKHPATILSENNKIYSSTFEAAVENNIKRMVFISSSMVFESTTSFPSKETHLTKIPPPVTGYGFSKLIGEYYCRKFKHEFNLDYTVVRPFNAYGIHEYPGDYVGYAHVIPDLAKKIMSKQYPLELLGDGEQTRCFTHVKDLARGIVVAMESKKAINEDFNIGTDKETTMIELAKMLWNLCGRKEPFKVKYVQGFKHDIKKRIPDVSKAKQLLDWEPQIKLQDGLKEVIAWLSQKIKKDI